MNRFKQHDIIALILIRKDSSSTFNKEKKFLQDAKRKGVNVWIRTNRVTPKGGFPGYPNGTIDFSLNKQLQNDVLCYLDKVCSLSKEFPNLRGIVIGGEELVGAHINIEEIRRWDSFFFTEKGFHLTEKMSVSQQKIYYDWMQEINNQWYAAIYNHLHSKYPKLEFFVFPSSAAIDDNNKYASFPRPAHWDLYDLIVRKNIPYSIIYESYNIHRKDGILYTAAQSAYLRDITNGKVPIYTIHQAQRAKGEKEAPAQDQIIAHVFTSIVNGSKGIGFWSTDMDTKQDIYITNKARWESLFQIIDKAKKWNNLTKITPNIYIIKPRYSFFLNNNPANKSAFDTFISLYKKGFSPGFLLEENNIHVQSKKIINPSLIYDKRSVVPPSSFEQHFNFLEQK